MEISVGDNGNFAMLMISSIVNLTHGEDSYWNRKSELLTHWGRVTHICADNLTIIDSDNGLSPGRHQAIIWTNAGILLIEHLETNFSEVAIEIQTFSFKKNHFLNFVSASMS